MMDTTHMTRPIDFVPRDSGPSRLAVRRSELETKYESLSGREQEVLRGVAYGHTNREIAEHLGVSVKSVETYRYRLSEKLEFAGRSDLVRFALDLGLLCADKVGLPSLQ
jgi:DNA-binding NarL/FixJ family response regulator